MLYPNDTSKALTNCCCVFHILVSNSTSVAALALTGTASHSWLTVKFSIVHIN